MDDHQERRREMLRRLVTLETTTAPAGGWDSDELMPLTRADALRVLSRHADGSLSADAVAQWADAIEGRDDVGREPGFEQALTDFLFELANPELAGPLTPELVARWTAALS